MILMRILIYGAGVIGEKSMKNEEYKKCQLKNLQKQQEDMKVAMLVFTKCARKIIRIHRHFLTV